VLVLSGHPLVGGATVTGTNTLCESVPLVPVTVTLLLVPVGVEASAHTFSIDEPDVVTLVGIRVALMPVEGLAVNWTRPLKPPEEVTVMEPVLQLPCMTVIVLGVLVLVTAKSWTLTVTFAVCTRLRLVPVMVTTYVPAEPVQLSRLVPEPPAIVAVLRLHASPVAGETEVVSVTVPVKPLTGITVTVELADWLGVVLTMVGLANIWKSTTWTLIVAVVCDSVPLVPVTVTV